MATFITPFEKLPSKVSAALKMQCGDSLVVRITNSTVEANVDRKTSVYDPPSAEETLEAIQILFEGIDNGNSIR